jgi:hypothetical protein
LILLCAALVAGMGRRFCARYDLLRSAPADNT